jgi:hypothetical protein
LFLRFDQALKTVGFLAMGGQIIDATIIAGPKPRNTWRTSAPSRKAAFRTTGKPSPPSSRNRIATRGGPSKAKPREDGKKQVDLAIPAFGYKNHIGVDKTHRVIRAWMVAAASRHEAATLPRLLVKTNTGSNVWTDTACRSKKNEKHLKKAGLKTAIHRKKPRGKPMPERTAKANAAKLKVRAAIEQHLRLAKGADGPVHLLDRAGTCHGENRARNLVTNMRRMAWLTQNATAA